MSSPKQLVFLFHASRSGSTYLASLLDAIDGVGVSVESEFIGDMVDRKFRLHNRDDLDNLLMNLYSERKFLGWRIAEDDLRRALADLARPAEIEAVVRAVLALHLPNPEIDYFVLKGGGRIRRSADRLHEIFPGSKIIHLVRDPRAVINSQMRTASPDKGKPLAIRPLRAAVTWRRQIERMDAIAKTGCVPVLEIRYEDLIHDQADALRRICDFLQREGLRPLRPEPRGEPAEYFSRLAEADKAIHENVARGRAVPERLNAWRKELSGLSVALIQQTAGPAMRRLDYPMLPIGPMVRLGASLYLAAVRLKRALAGR